MIADFIILPLFWFFAFFFISAVGYALEPFKKRKGILSINLFNWFWYGLGIIIGFLQIWNLFLPVNIITWACMLPFAIYGGNKLLKFFQTDIRKNIANPIIWAFGIPILIFLIISSFDNSYIYDSVVYHFYSIKWFNNYPVTPGMGNLFIYLGLNQSYFLFPAFLNSLWGNYHGACAANGLLAIVICSDIIIGQSKVFSRHSRISFLGVCQLLFLPLCVNVGVQNLSSPTPDVFVNLLTVKVLFEILACLESKKPSFQDLFLIAFYCTMGIIMKLSFMCVALGVFTLGIILYFIIHFKELGFIVRSGFLLLLLLIPWLIRGAISTGYIGFPLSLFGVPVDWKMPKDVVVNFAAYIKGFARSHLHGQAGIAAAYNYNWLPGWLTGMVKTFGVVFPVSICIFSCVLMRIRKIDISQFAFIFIPLLASILFWFFMAPDVRFARFVFWALGIIPLAYLIANLPIKWINSLNTMAFIYICTILIITKNWNEQIQPLGYLPPINKKVFKTKSGLIINTIKDNPSGQSWEINDCLLPCSVYPDSNLVQRGNGIKDGFKIAPGEK